MALLKNPMFGWHTKTQAGFEGFNEDLKVGFESLIGSSYLVCRPAIDNRCPFVHQPLAFSEIMQPLVKLLSSSAGLRATIGKYAGSETE